MPRGDDVLDVLGGGGEGLSSLLSVVGVGSGTSLKFLVCNSSVLDDLLHFPNITMVRGQGGRWG